MFFGLTGMPIRNSVFATIVLAEAEPEPLTVANFDDEIVDSAHGVSVVLIPWDARRLFCPVRALHSSQAVLTSRVPCVPAGPRKLSGLSEIRIVVAEAGR